MQYEQLVHDQSLYCGNQSLEISKQLAVLSRQKPSESTKINARRLQKQKDSNESRIACLRYMYGAANREDLEKLMYELTLINLEEHLTALADPTGWQEACEIAGVSPNKKSYVAPEIKLQQWRINFLQAIQSNP